MKPDRCGRATSTSILARSAPTPIASRNLSLKQCGSRRLDSGLEIEADDVRCTHGAAISQVDREEIFYLRRAVFLKRSRAVDRERFL